MVRPPPPETMWAVSHEFGSMWTSRVSDPVNDLYHVSDHLTLETLRKILVRLEGERLFVGHIKTRDQRVALRHSLYGNLVVQINTGISSYDVIVLFIDIWQFP